ncbi:MAG TPA: GNAT family N-acetyltransferase [Nocardioides sp.]|nr:GNAT family N-acetyltransferase [Nocardioides sp.]
MTFVLRDAVADDAEAVARIYVESWNAGFAGHLPSRALTAGQVRRWERDLAGAVSWRVALESGVPIGFAGTGVNRDPVEPLLGELDTIAVSPEWWRRGVGRALMLDALESMRAAGFRSALLWTLAEYPRGERFYRRHGWSLGGMVRDSGRQVAYRHPLTGYADVRADL